MRRDDHRQGVGVGQAVEHATEPGELFGKVDVLLAMRTDDEVFPLLQSESLEHVAPLDLRQVVVEHLVHRAAGLDDAVGRQALAEQILARNAAVGKVDVGDVVDDLAVDLLGHPLVEAAIARLHVEDGDLLPLGRDRGQAGVRIAEDEHGVRPDFAEQRIDLGDDQADRFGGRRARGARKWSGLRISRSSKKISFNS